MKRIAQVTAGFEERGDEEKVVLDGGVFTLKKTSEFGSNVVKIPVHSSWYRNNIVQLHVYPHNI